MRLAVINPNSTRSMTARIAVAARAAAPRCGYRRADLHGRPGSDARNKVSAEIAQAMVEDHAGAIVLGCAGMADLAADLSAEHGVPVIDGVAAACGFAQTLVRLGGGH
jgi:allantoin racemase